MRRKSKWCFGVFLAALLAVVCGGMAGCGDNAIMEGVDGGAREGTVSGAAVSGASVLADKSSPVKGTCCTDTNLYIQTWMEKDQLPDGEEDYLISKDAIIPGVVQMRLDGSCKKKIDMGERFSSLIGVTGSWIYYTTREKKSEDDRLIEIYRMPIKKGADGYDEVETTEVERVIGESGAVYGETEIFVDENYLLYLRKAPDIDEDEEIIAYDLQKREEVDFGEKIYESSDVEYIWRMGDQYAVLMSEGFRVMSPEAARWEQVLDSCYMIDGEADWNEHYFFYECFPSEEDEGFYTPGPDYMDKDMIRVYDGKKDRGFITRKELKKAVENAVESTEKFKVDEMENRIMTDLFCDDDKCYIEVQVAGTHDGIYYMGCLMFSKKAGDKKIRYEKDLTECMREHGKEWEGRWYVKKKKEKKVIKEHSIVNPTLCHNVINGKVYFYFYDQKNKRHLAYYDTDTGRTFEITHLDPVYYEKFYNGGYEVYEDFLFTGGGEEVEYKATEQIDSMAIWPEGEEDAHFEAG